MGCGGGRGIVNGVVKSNKAFNLLNDIKSKFITVFRSNPFYTMNLTKLRSISEHFDKNVKSMDEYITELDGLDNITKAMLKEVLVSATDKLQFVFPQENFEKTVLFCVLLFMAKPVRDDIKKEKRKVIINLFDHTKDKTESTKYRSGKFSFLIANLIQFICNMLIYCLLSVVILQTFDNFSLGEVEKLLVDKIVVKNIIPARIQEYYALKFEKINPKLKDSAPILDCCLPYVFEPIKDLVQGESEAESVIISEKEIDDIISRIIFLDDPFNFIDIFLTLKIKDY
jgi:hypothetical protein